MIDALYMKKDIRRFLDNFSKDQWENILPCLVRIGIEYLKRNFDTVNFTAKDFKNVLSEMKGKKEKKEKKEESKNSRGRSRSVSAIRFVARKPSSEWRKGKEEIFEHGNLSQLKKLYSNSREISRDPKAKEEENNKECPSSSLSPMSRLNPKIYPNWWRDESKEDDFANSFSKPQKDYRKQRAEQEVSSQFYIENPLEYKLKSKSKERSKTPNRIKYVSEHTRLSTNPNKFKEDLKYTESKIRTNVLYDKKIHKQLKKRRNLYPDAKEWKYDDYLQSNNIQAEYNEEDRRTQGDNKRRPKIDYMISYDKELKPELIRQKSRERNAYTGKERRNQVIINQNKEENKDHQAKSNVQTGNFSQENFNRTNDVSFKRSNREQEQSEKLSSYAPSERNANMEREYDRPNQGEGRYGDDYYNSSTRDYYKYDNPPEYDSMLMRYYDRQKYSN